MAVAGNKGQNGTFKPRTQEEVCKRMRDKIPEITINVRWSIKLNDVVDMMNTSGFGWDDTRKCVISDNSQVLYENILKLATMLIKEFEKLQGIFGKDRANGRGAERCEDAMENQIGENQVSDDDEWLHQHDNSPSFIGNTFVGPPSK
ncbi:hypothetical protein GmHk_04G009974 [Glycine max]|nr:hypothetical protein GmHk_04G009974 [Glycine max]